MTLTAHFPVVQDVRMPRLVLIHGAATTARVWDELTATLSSEFEVVAPQRQYSGDWDTELDDLAQLCTGAFVVGVSGGATLGLGLAVRGVELRGAILHEPAAGSLAPHLLDHAIAAMASGGAPSFGTALYGPGWTANLLPENDGAVSRDLAMFRRFEPQSPTRPIAGIVLTVGENSPALRHESVRAVAAVVGARVIQVPGASHAVHLDAVPAFAARIRAEAGASVAPARTLDSARANVPRKGN